MEARFVQRDDGVIDVDLGPAWRALEAALLDAVTTRAPRGSKEPNPSTYWIDRTVEAIEHARNGAVTASGNSTELVSSGEDVIAHSQYEAFEDQPVSQTELLDLLRRWREVVRSSTRGA